MEICISLKRRSPCPCAAAPPEAQRRRSLVFWSEALKKGLSVGYPTITLHAISRKPMQPWIPAADSEVSDNAQPNGEHPEDLSAQPEGPACIFCQLDMPAEADPEDAEDEYETTDLIITPPEQSNSWLISFTLWKKLGLNDGVQSTTSFKISVTVPLCSLLRCQTMTKAIWVSPQTNHSNQMMQKLAQCVIMSHHPRVISLINLDNISRGEDGRSGLGC